MVTQKPSHTLLRATFYAAWCVAFLTPVMVVTGPHFRATKQGKPTPLFTSGNTTTVSSVRPQHAELNQEGILPNILTTKDVVLYRAIFAAQKARDFAKADEAIARLDNPLLMGHVLAQRYLDRSYKADERQLADWLNHYSDHPQAADIYIYTMARNPALRHEVPAIRKQAALPGYGDSTGMDTQADNGPYSNYWHAGLSAWKYGQKGAAAQSFAAMADHQKELSPWMASASAYWAYRSYHAIGNHAAAGKYLHMAADHPRSFYGILACKQLHLPLHLDISPMELTDSDVLEMVGDETVRRVVALAQVNQNELAEEELRLRFPQADDNDKERLLALAHELGLASVQISMAQYMGSDGHELDFARYPIPSWQPEGGYRIDPLLIYALMRQESGFRPSAVSRGGALGLMQLMPKTASLMQKQMNPDLSMPEASGNVSEPITNITLGQTYVESLLGNNLVEGNLVYLLAAYNAGPGRVQEWRNADIGHNDPLLFVESIPLNETRHYVMQVMTNYWIYSELAGETNYSIAALLKNKWPSYDGYQGRVASRSTQGHAG